MSEVTKFRALKSIIILWAVYNAGNSPGYNTVTAFRNDAIKLSLSTRTQLATVAQLATASYSSLTSDLKSSEGANPKD